MDEFALIRQIVDTLGDHARGDWLTVAAGDDAAVIQNTPQHEQVASIDTLVEDVHFPQHAPPELVGYRAMMVSLSDLAAMAATPRYVLVALSLTPQDQSWALALAQGIRAAAEQTGVLVAGGNLAQGSRQISVSVHGEVPDGTARLRSGAAVGDYVMVSGNLGGAAACVRTAHLTVSGELDPLQSAYYRPQARFDLVDTLRQYASAAIDVSDGLLSDVMHIARASKVGVSLHSEHIPVCPGATIDDALRGGDDYQIVCTAAKPIDGFTVIGEVIDGTQLMLDGQTLSAQQVQDGGYNHFSTAS